MFVWVAFAALAAAAPLGSGPLHLEFTTSQLQGETYIWQIIETPGRQIIAAGERLSFYEGGRWTAVDGLRKSTIRCLLVEGQDLWVGSPGQLGKIRLPLRSDSHYEAIEIAGLSEAGEVWQLVKSGDAIVATTKDDVWFYHPATKQTSRTRLQARQRLTTHTLDGNVVIDQSGAALWKINGSSLEPFENPLADISDLGWIWADSSSVLTSKALYQKNTDSSFRPVVPTSTLSNQSVITSACRWGELFVVATLSRGITLLDLATGKSQFLTTASGLPSLVVCFVFPDSAGRLWVGTSHGIALFENPKFGRQFTDPNTPVFAVRKDGLFVGHDDSAVFFHDDGHEEIFPNKVYEFTSTRLGNVLGLWAHVQLGTTTIPVPANRVGANIELPNGELLVTSSEAVHLVNLVAGTASPVTSPQTEFTGFTIIGKNLWAAAANGSLYRSPIAPPIVFEKVADLPGTGLTSLTHLGNMLISASSYGVRFGDKLSPVEGTRALQNPRLAENSDGLWLLGEQDGVHRLGRLVLSGDTVEWQTVEAKGLTLLADPHSLNGSGHSLLICGENQILELNSDQLQPAYRLDAPRLNFTFSDAKTGAISTANTPPEKLSAEKNSLTFTGTLAFDEFGERPAYERRLLPTETTWIPTKAGEKVSYPSLSPRDYTLEVRATHLGHTGPVTMRTFTVLPPWYASSGAFAGYGVLALLSFYSLYRFRTHQIRQRNLELERLVEKRTHELAQASAAKTEFLASMSHEIRNPMNGVIGLVNILREEPLGPRQARTLKMLHGCAEQLRTTVDDILDFSKIEAGRVVLERTTFDLLDTLEASAATIDPSGAKIRFIEKPPANLSLVGDAGKLRQIFANYASNALKYGIPPEARVNTILVPSNDGVRLTLSVTSSGPTIDKDTLDKFFESFTRGTDAMERNIHGTGLGLAICRRFAQAMGGEVGAVSTNGETTFYLNVPFARADAAALAPVVAPERSALPARALAIEDEDYNRIVLGNILTKMNYSVDWATTGAEALKLAQENGYDIVLTDYRLPDTNGVDLAREILRLCPEPKPAVFAVTAYSTRERREECLRAGMAGFISKPITLEKLRSTLAGWGDKQLTTISLESSRRPLPPQPPAAIESGWIELKRAAMFDTKRAAELAHRLNNVCRAFNYLDLAEQLELLEGALEREEPAAPFLEACERLLRPSAADQSS